MKVIVGLGNPGREYAATRHNIGFMVVDELARRLSATDRRSRFRAEVTEVFDHGEKLVLVKPQTYMNLSGTSVREAARWYKTPAEEVMVIADEIHLPFGTLRMRAAGGSAGHNGLKSIFAELGTQGVPRLRIGVGRGSGHATRQVLSRFTPEEARMLPEIVAAAADCVLDWERHGVLDAMNRCNRHIEPPAPADSGDPGSRDAWQAASSSKEHLSGAAGAYNRAVAWWTRHVGSGGDEGVDRHK